MNLLCDILFGLRVMLLNMLSYPYKLLHFVQKLIKLLRQSSFALIGLCIYLSKILNQMKIRNRFVHFSIFFYFKELVWQNFGYLCIYVLDVRLVRLALVYCPHSSNHLSTLLLYLNNLTNWFRKITEYSHVFIPNVHMLRSPLVLCSNSLNHSSNIFKSSFFRFLSLFGVYIEY